MEFGTLVTVLSQLTMAAAALRLAKALQLRVDNHETRLTEHDERITTLEVKAA